MATIQAEAFVREFLEKIRTSDIWETKDGSRYSSVRFASGGKIIMTAFKNVMQMRDFDVELVADSETSIFSAYITDPFSPKGLKFRGNKAESE